MELKDKKAKVNNKMCKVKYEENILDDLTSYSLFDYLYDCVKWNDGIKSKNRFTRKQKALSMDDTAFLHISPYIIEIINKLSNGISYKLHGVYLNLYEDGMMYTPNHTHKNYHQIVISLGEPRTLIVGKKEYKMKNGSAIIFGTYVHGVPKEENIKFPRISIAIFMQPI